MEETPPLFPSLFSLDQEPNPLTIRIGEALREAVFPLPSLSPIRDYNEAAAFAGKEMVALSFLSPLVENQRDIDIPSLLNT